MIVQTGAQVRIGMLLGKNDLTQAQVASGTSITLNWIIMLLYVLPGSDLSAFHREVLPYSE